MHKVRTPWPTATRVGYIVSFEEGRRRGGGGGGRPPRCPSALQGQVLDVIRAAHRELGLGVRRLHAHLSRAKVITCSISSIYRVLRRCGALVRRPRKPKPDWIRYARAIPGERA